MGILQTLAEMQERSAIITIGDVRLKVGSSDHDAAQTLIKFLDTFADGERTNGEAEMVLLENWMKAVLELAPPEGGHLSWRDVSDDPKVRALWDAIFWFRFLIALDDKKLDA